MINIHANVAGTPTDVPRLVVEPSGSYPGNEVHADMAVSGRASFHLPDGTPPHGADIYYNKRSVRTVIAMQVGVQLLPGDYEGGLMYEPIPTLDYRSAATSLRPLVIDGTRFATDDGMPWFGLTTTDFLLFNRVLRGEDITEIVQQRKAAGLNEHRVTLLMQFLPGLRGWPILRPENYNEYWTILPQFVDLMAGYGQRVKLTGMCDMQMINRDPAWQRAFLRQVADTLRGKTNWRLEPGNEHDVNGWHPRELERIPGVLMSRGSNSIDKPAYAPGFDWHEFHRRRDWPKHANSDDLGFTAAGSIENTHDVPRPVDDGEPIGFDETYQINRRLTSREDARAIRYSAQAFAAATCFHNTPGLFSDLWGPVVNSCAQAFGGK